MVSTWFRRISTIAQHYICMRMGFSNHFSVFLNYFSVITADYNPAPFTTVWNKFNFPMLKTLPAYCKLMSVCLGFSLIYCTCIVALQAQHLAELLNKMKCKFCKITQAHMYTCGVLSCHRWYKPSSSKHKQWKNINSIKSIFIQYSHAKYCIK